MRAIKLGHRIKHLSRYSRLKKIKAANFEIDG